MALKILVDFGRRVAAASAMVLAGLVLQVVRAQTDIMGKIWSNQISKNHIKKNWVYAKKFSMGFKGLFS